MARVGTSTTSCLVMPALVISSMFIAGYFKLVLLAVEAGFKFALHQYAFAFFEVVLKLYIVVAPQHDLGFAAKIFYSKARQSCGRFW